MSKLSYSRVPFVHHSVSEIFTSLTFAVVSMRAARSLLLALYECCMDCARMLRSLQERRTDSVLSGLRDQNFALRRQLAYTHVDGSPGSQKCIGTAC